MNENFPAMWEKYEVIGNGWIEVERMALFYKDLLKDYTISIQWDYIFMYFSRSNLFKIIIYYYL